MNAAPSRRQARIFLRLQAGARMPAASRALRSGLAIVALGISAGCTKPAGPAPFAAMSAPPEAGAAASTPPSITERAAIDAALAAALVGAWSESVTIDGTAFDTLITYAADRTFTLAVTPKDQKQAAPTTSAGTWSIQNGFLNTRLAGDTSPDTPDEILKISVNEFLYRSGDDKSTRIATRRSVDIEKGRAAEAEAKAAATTPQPELVVEDTRYAAMKEVETHTFYLAAPAQIRLQMEISNTVPLNVIVLPGKWTPDEYWFAINYAYLGQLLPEAVDKTAKKINPNTLFSSRLSKRAAYERFDSPWVTLDPGIYTVIFDNSGEVSPARGDAPVRFRLYRYPVL